MRYFLEKMKEYISAAAFVSFHGKIFDFSRRKNQ